MSLHLAAKHLSSKGRGPDSALVHMAPGEVAGLQALAKAHGGSLSVNPDTGLPEAGFLSSILPAIAGFALGPAGFGLMSPMMAGATVGGIGALTSGNLGKGLMAGMGAYGGAGLGAGLVGMGEQAMNAPMLNAAAEAARLGDPTGGLAGLNSNMMGQASQASGWDKAVAGAKAGWNDPSKLVSGLGGGSSKKGYGYLAAAAAPTVMEALTPKQSSIGVPRTDAATAQKVRYNPSTGRYDPIVEAKYAEGGTTPWNTKWKPDVPDYGQQDRDFSKEILYYDMANNLKPEDETLKKPIAADVNNAALAGYQLGDGVQGGNFSAGPTYSGFTGLTPDFADSLGSIDSRTDGAPSLGAPSSGGSFSPPADSFGPGGIGFGGVDTNAGEGGVGGVGGPGGVGAGDGAGSRDNDGPGSGLGWAAGGMAGYAAGGLGSLGSYSDGGRLLRGPGDGVSDDIPATIGEHKQPARLADGEFVIPARIVSEIGNGSTEAGSRKLYAMMDRIQNNRKKSIGKNKVAVNSKSDRYLPA